MKVALVHDWLNQLGGAEDVLEAMVQLFPSAPLYTSLYWSAGMPPHWQKWDIRLSFIDKLPFAHKKQQLYFPLYPAAFEQFDFRGYDLVLSNKSGFCHGLITDPETLHICYCLTPTRYVWRYHQYAEQENLGRLTRLGLAPFLTALRVWDRLGADRVDEFIAISQVVQQRIKKIYHRDSTIIYPPVDTGRFTPLDQAEDYYFFVGRLVPYRRLDKLIEAFNELGRPLVIAGSGRDRARLESLAKPNVKFLGYVPDEELPNWLARCKAFMWPGEEDFGIAPVQAMACGRPVLAYAAGGAWDIVKPGTGRLFYEQTSQAIQEAVLAFDQETVHPEVIRAHAEQFDTKLFQQKLAQFIDEKLNQHQQKLA